MANDPLVQACLEKAEGEAQRAAWAQVCLDHVWPVVRKMARSKVGVSASRSWEAEEEDTVEQLASEAFAAVHARFEHIKRGQEIASLRSYAASTLERAYWNWLKRRYPNRYSLKNEIVDTLRSDPRLDHWQAPIGANVGGKSNDSGKNPATNGNTAKMAAQPDTAVRSCFPTDPPSVMLMPDYLMRLFEWIPGPCERNALVSFSVVALNRLELDYLPPDDLAEPASAESVTDEVTARTILVAMWEELAELQEDRRGVFLLFEPPGRDQEALIPLLVSEGIADLEQIADFVGLTLEQVCGLMRTERVTLEQVAQLYEVPTKQAEGIRKGVVERLARRFERNGLYRAFKRADHEAVGL